MRLKLPTLPVPPPPVPEVQAPVLAAPRPRQIPRASQALEAPKSRVGIQWKEAPPKPRLLDPRLQLEKGWERDFELLRPGDLGPWARGRQGASLDNLRYRRRVAPEVLLPGDAPAVKVPKRKPEDGLHYAAEVLDRFEGCPATFFHGRHYTAENLTIYLGASNALRGEAFRRNGEPGAPRWGATGWARDEGQLVLSLISELRDMIRDADGSVVLALEHIQDPAQRALYEAAFRAGVSSGLMVGSDWPLRGQVLDWEQVHSSCLAMRIFSEEQLSYLAPWRNMSAVRSSVDRWQRQGYIKPHQGDFPMPMFRVTESGAKTVVKAGLVSEDEAQSRLAVRRTQELHDLAVGDAIMLAALDITQRGGGVDEIVSETRLLVDGIESGKTGLVLPDFRMRYTLDGVTQEMGVEVIGVGNNYRTTAKRQKVLGSGLRMLDPGLSGGGFRYV